jgi:hypothetical protein
LLLNKNRLHVGISLFSFSLANKKKGFPITPHESYTVELTIYR